jgi:hypothetical protein
MAINMKCYIEASKTEYNRLAVPVTAMTIVSLITIALIVWWKDVVAAIAPHTSAINIWIFLLVITAVIYYLAILTATNTEAEKTKSTETVAVYGGFVFLYFMFGCMGCTKIMEQIIVEIAVITAVTMAIIIVTTPLAIAYARCKVKKV